MKIPMEDWLRGCVYHDGRNGEVTLPTDKVIEIANYIQKKRTSVADGMIELMPEDEKERTMNMPKCSTCRRWKKEYWCIECNYEAKDLVDVVRCKNCRHNNNCEIQYSSQAGSEFFCGSAERREE